MSEDKTTLTERKALPHLTWMHYLKELENENPQSIPHDLTVVCAQAGEIKLYDQQLSS